MGTKSAKRRPGTASRKNQNTLGTKKQNYIGLSGSGSGVAALGGVPLSAKAASQIDLEVSKLRPRFIQQERERLYDDVMR